MKPIGESETGPNPIWPFDLDDLAGDFGLAQRLSFGMNPPAPEPTRKGKKTPPIALPITRDSQERGSSLVSDIAFISSSSEVIMDSKGEV